VYRGRILALQMGVDFVEGLLAEVEVYRLNELWQLVSRKAGECSATSLQSSTIKPTHLTRERLGQLTTDIQA
jgi:hypothetical protein